MKATPDGLLWDNTDDRFERRKAVLVDKGWVQYKNTGFWYLKHLLPTVEDVTELLVNIDDAYRIANNEKNEPPEPVWLKRGYTPYLEDANILHGIDLFKDDELINAAYEITHTNVQHVLLFDIECYINYFLIAFKSITLNKIVYFEMDDSQKIDINKLLWVMANFCIVGFNSRNYDIPMASLAASGFSTPILKQASDKIIVEGVRTRKLMSEYKSKLIGCNHIDIMEVAPLKGSLKAYGGRVHTKRMQDLPYPPERVLSEDEIIVTRYYCFNDLENTGDLHGQITKELALRETMSMDYGLDLRSKSDAQVAEAVISKEVEAINGHRCSVPIIDAGTVYYYKVPPFIKFYTPAMQNILNIIAQTQFIVGEKGGVSVPPELENLNITIGNGVYKMGIGGLHSSEKSAAHHADIDNELVEIDVISFYPFIILNQGLFPIHLGAAFLAVYRDIVDRRLAGKAAGIKTIADTLKIVINGSFGKLGSKYSILYSPDLLIQTTITGQLSLLMLIERMEMEGIPAVSANTDGIVLKCPRPQSNYMRSIVEQWELETNFEMEYTNYSSLYSRDVNNYIAVKDYEMRADGGDINEWVSNKANQLVDIDKLVKTKGVFAKAGLSKNPQNEICIDALKEYLINGVPIENTIRTCRDITKFINVRTVKGGGVKIFEKGMDGEYLGKVARWYYAIDQVGRIVYASSGNMVPNSIGARPVMDLPDAFPLDVDYEWYITETQSMLSDIGL